MASTNVTPFQLSNFRVVKHVTRQLLKMANDTPYFIKVESAFAQAEQMKNPKLGSDGKPIPPPFIINVTNLENGAPCQMVANEVFRSELQKQYKDDSYIGKVFEVVKNTKAEGKSYNTFGITELEPVEETKPVISTSKK